MFAWLIATPVSDHLPAAGKHPGLYRAREQIVTTLIRVEALVDLISFVFSLAPVMQLGMYGVLAGYGAVLLVAWLLAINRQLSYRLRGGTLIMSVYLLALNELMHFGYSVREDNSIVRTDDEWSAEQVRSLRSGYRGD